MISENIIIQIIINLGSIASALTGYIIWSWKNTKRLEEKRQDERLEDRNTVKRDNDSRRQELEETQKVLSRQLKDLETKIDMLTDLQMGNVESLSLLFESVILQFEAFRKSGLLNGESERQEKKIKEFLTKRASMSLKPEEEDK